MSTNFYVVKDGSDGGLSKVDAKIKRLWEQGPVPHAERIELGTDIPVRLGGAFN